MRRLLLLLAFAALVPGASLGQGNSDFPQTGGQSGSQWQSQGQGQSQSQGQWQGQTQWQGQNQGLGASSGDSDFSRTDHNVGANGYGLNDKSEAKPNLTTGPSRDGSKDSKKKGARGPGEKGGPDDAEAPKDGPDAREGDGGGSMDMEGAKVNFTTVVEAYVVKKSPKGYWLHADAKGGKTRRLKFLSVDDGSIARAGRGRYSGAVKLRDARDGRRVSLNFTVDFTGAEWKVVKISSRP